jgi:hypothetical protein
MPRHSDTGAITTDQGDPRRHQGDGGITWRVPADQPGREPRDGRLDFVLGLDHKNLFVQAALNTIKYFLTGQQVRSNLILDKQNRLY